MKKNQQPQQIDRHSKQTGETASSRQHLTIHKHLNRPLWGRPAHRKSLLYLFALCSALLLFSTIDISTGNTSHAKAISDTASSVQGKKTILPNPFPPFDTPTPTPTTALPTPTPTTPLPSPTPTTPLPTPTPTVGVTPTPTPIPVTSPTPTPCVFYILCITPTVTVTGPTPTPIPITTPTPAPGVTPTTATGAGNGPTQHPTPTPRPTTTTSQTLNGDSGGGTGGGGTGIGGGGGNTSTGSNNASGGKTGNGLPPLALIIPFFIVLVTLAGGIVVYLAYKQYKQRNKPGTLAPPVAGSATPLPPYTSAPAWTPFGNLQDGNMANNASSPFSGVADVGQPSMPGMLNPGDNAAYGPFSMNGIQEMPPVPQYGAYDAPTMAASTKMLQNNYTEPVPTEAMTTAAPPAQPGSSIGQEQINPANSGNGGNNLTDPLMDAIIRQAQMGLFFLQGKEAEPGTDLGD
jgi:hypothetical protein